MNTAASMIIMFVLGVWVGYGYCHSKHKKYIKVVIKEVEDLKKIINKSKR